LSAWSWLVVVLVASLVVGAVPTLLEYVAPRHRRPRRARIHRYPDDRLAQRMRDWWAFQRARR
jgi:hypothetical protein